MNNSINFEVKTTIDGTQIINQVGGFRDEVYHHIQTTVADTIDFQFKEALIKLGWLPPELHHNGVPMRSNEIAVKYHRLHEELEKRSVWVLTYETNDYDQWGEYFLAVFGTKPTREDLLHYVPGEMIEDTLQGKIRNKEDMITPWTEWYYLREHRL